MLKVEAVVKEIEWSCTPDISPVDVYEYQCDNLDKLPLRVTVWMDDDNSTSGDVKRKMQQQGIVESHFDNRPISNFTYEIIHAKLHTPDKR